MTQRPVNLDSIFPKEIMDRAVYFLCHDEDNEIEDVCETVESAMEYYFAEAGFEADKVYEVELMAFSDTLIRDEEGEENLEEISRVRISLSLQIYLVEGEGND